MICPDAFADQAAAGAIVQAYSGQSVILDDTQKANFSANCISIGQSSLFLSERAAEHLGSRHRKALVDWGFELHATDLSELERAGGSLRCMVAEIY